ncbi:helix-turn-helix domain-containing protein [Streptomyces sp. WI04-05B]|uniref:helix-turn-helix domain-containing protein n=1 Tax=Streptomyces TaxID=1883 RepID=UPI0029A77C9C|nr:MULTISPECIES: helix-turn-helix domain-containing protein [unclassified Streptomyces]MDX2542201.1 helix-turn-helix domain-containing protein [Streptomyces sp. WI04-05B]MDX2584033.1 helix-turn-helix domain-containing protein [Streptomyces sp. WI04-05A]
MDTKNLSVPPHPEARGSGNNRPHRRSSSNASGVSGVVHDNTRHDTRFTVIGNHLAQHPELSLLAIGLAVHIQSLPAGALVDIKTLARKFPEGADRIAAALRELETHGYLRRSRERVPDGRIVTRTTSCNQPERHRAAGLRAEPQPQPNPDPEPGLPADQDPIPEPPARPAHPTTAAPGPPKKRTPSKPLPAVPQPAYKGEGLLQAATELLAGLRRLDPDMLLSVCDTAHLAPGVAAWLERDASPTAVRHALTRDLPPEGMRRPAAFLAHRLTAQLPPPAPYRAPAASTPAVRSPLQTCDGCERAFRAPGPGRCRDCRSDLMRPTGQANNEERVR